MQWLLGNEKSRAETLVVIAIKDVLQHGVRVPLRDPEPRSHLGQCLGFGVWGLGFGVWGLGFGVEDVGFRV